MNTQTRIRAVFFTLALCILAPTPIANAMDRSSLAYQAPEQSRHRETRVTYLHEVALKGDVHALRICLEDGDYNINAITFPRKTTPLLAAVESECAQAVDLLLQHGADPSLQTENGTSPLLKAVMTGSCEVIKVLINHNVPLNASHKKGGLTALALAALQNKQQIALTLLDGKADVNARCITGHVPLHRAKTAAMARLLLERGAEKDAVTSPATNAITPLLAATHAELLDVANVLIEYGADVNKACTNGFTPLHVAASQGAHALVELLLKAGADKNIKTVKGNTPYDLVLLERSLLAEQHICSEIIERQKNNHAIALLLAPEGVTVPALQLKEPTRNSYIDAWLSQVPLPQGVDIRCLVDPLPTEQSGAPETEENASNADDNESFDSIC